MSRLQHQVSRKMGFCENNVNRAQAPTREGSNTKLARVLPISIRCVPRPNLIFEIYSMYSGVQKVCTPSPASANASGYEKCAA